MLWAMSDAAVVQIVTLIVSCVTGCVTGYFGWQTLIVKSKQKENNELAIETAATAQSAANQVAHTAEKVAGALQITTESRSRKLDDLAIVAKATHSLVNSSLENQLGQTAALARRIAEMTNDPVDCEAAAVAEKAYKDHLARQSEVDLQPGTDAQKAGYHEPNPVSFPLM